MKSTTAHRHDSDRREYGLGLNVKNSPIWADRSDRLCEEFISAVATRSTEKFPKIEELENVEIRLYASGMESNFTLGPIIEPFILIFRY
jgi:hypothetical protein